MAACKADQHSSADPDLGDDVTCPLGLIIQTELEEEELNGTAVKSAKFACMSDLLL